MSNIEVNGKTVYTNYGEESAIRLCNGEYKKGYIMKTKDSAETTEQFFNRLIGYGYNKIMLRHASTYVPGAHKVIAYVAYAGRK